jgi:hypothetical protein
MGWRTEMDVIVTMRPHFWLCMIGSTARAKWMMLIRLRSAARCHSSVVVARNIFAGGPPALVTQTSTEPKVVFTCSTNCWTAVASVTSSGAAKTSAFCFWRRSSATELSFVSLREQMATLAPWAANFSAAARAIPSLEAAIGVVAVDPVLAGWVEDVEVYGVFESVGFVGEVGWDAEDFAGADDDFFVAAFVRDEELERAFENVADLFIVMMVHGDDGSLF